MSFGADRRGCLLDQLLRWTFSGITFDVERTECLQKN